MFKLYCPLHRSSFLVTSTMEKFSDIARVISHTMGLKIKYTIDRVITSTLRVVFVSGNITDCITSNDLIGAISGQHHCHIPFTKFRVIVAAVRREITNEEEICILEN